MIKETKIVIESFKSMVERQSTFIQPDYEQLITKLLGVRLMLVVIDGTLDARKLVDDYIQELEMLQDEMNKHS